MTQAMESEIKNNDDKLKYDASILPDLLPIYYKRLFPHKHFYRWLSYGLSEPSVFTNREISFTLADDIYIRYLSFDNQSEMEKEICSRIPYKIDIGAVMSGRPKTHRSSPGMQPVQRELVFDIDMTDYDEVRTCCEGASVCTNCWKFMTVACRILDLTLREDFNFEHILWVFSGRRGIHCWVCDKIARYLDTKGRSSIAEYLQIITTTGMGSNSISRVIINDKMHHSIKRAYAIIEPLFEEIILDDQNLFGTSKGLQKLLQMIPDENARKDVEIYLNNSEIGKNSKEIWKAFVQYANSMRNQTSSIWSRKLKNIIEEIQLALVYPRLDINVSKGFNHLLKAPFCIHPSTGKVCIPFNPNAAAKFDPTTVSTISTLLEEINAFDDNNKIDEEIEHKNRIKDYKKTGMYKGVVVFEEFLRKLEGSFKTKAIDISDAKMEF